MESYEMYRAAWRKWAELNLLPDQAERLEAKLDERDLQRWAHLRDHGDALLLMLAHPAMREARP